MSDGNDSLGDGCAAFIIRTIFAIFICWLIGLEAAKAGIGRDATWTVKTIVWIVLFLSGD